MAGNAPHIPGCRDLSLIGERVARSLFSATSDRVGRPVTVTVYPPLSEGRTRDGFDRAAATAQRLGAHPSVVTIHEWGHAADGRPWIVTDPQPAESVDTLLTMDGPLEVERALQVGVLLAGALETAHRAGIVHGDLSPARLVFGVHGEPLVAETGLAEFAVFPGLGALNNPVRYHAPPEVLERTEITPTTDVYSLATTVYALLAGRAPQQKPADITDSNASLLLRILQMAMPSIERPALPDGLEDALRGPLSPNPAKRPQQAIEVAWLLQDVQRRAGWAVTEPVILDLDDVAAGPQPAAPHGVHAAGPGLLAPLDAPLPVEAGPAPVPPAGADVPIVDPWGTIGRLPAGDAWPAPPTPLDPVPFEPAPPMFDPALAPYDPMPEVEAEADEVLPPTIFPFAEGLDGPPADHGAAAATVEPLWPSPADADAPSESLWPSTWPAADQAAAEPPAWAAPPVDPGGTDSPATLGQPPAGGPGSDAHAGDAIGDDGGSIGDVAEIAPANGSGGTTAAPAFGAIERPPELDELPAWYTDPLPNAGVPPGTNGHGNGHGPSGSSAPWENPSAPWENPSQTNGHTGHPAGLTGPPPADGQRPRRDERLPGAGDELRSLFGEVVGDPDDAAGPAAPAALPRPGAPGGPDADPLGPPQARPPIDLSQLDTPLGPSPYLAPGSGRPDVQAPAARSRTADEVGSQAPARLPRRGEAQTWPPAGPGAGAGAQRLPRATEGDPRRPTGDGTTRPPAAELAPRLDRPAPRQVAPVGDKAPRTGGGAAMAGPPALPLMVLIGVVAVLILGVAWLVITGDDAEPPASDRPERSVVDEAAVTGVQVEEAPEGVQVTWTGDAEASYVVTVLSADRPPEVLPPTLGTSVLVPNVGDAAAAAGRCFTVAVVPDAGAEAAPAEASEPACTAGATVDGMQGG